MKNRIISFILTLTLVVSSLFGTAVFAGAEGGAAKLEGTDLNLAENITVRMYVSVANAADGDYAIVTLPDGKSSKTLLADAEKSGDFYLFYAEVAVKDFAKNITLEIYSNDEVVYTTTTTAKAYCDKYDGEFNALVAALEIYADAADRYFDDSKTAGDAIPINVSAIPAVERSEVLPAGITHRGATLVLESEMTIRHYFVLANGVYAENYAFFVDLDNDGECDSNEKLALSEKTDTEGNPVYYVDIAGITPNELDVAYTVGVYGKADDVTYTCTYGALTYVKSKASSNNAELKNLVAALYNYNAVASELTGDVYFDGVLGMRYEYGVNTPIVKAPASNNKNFIGWYDNNGIKYDTVPASYTGDLQLTARFGTELSKAHPFDVTTLATSYLIQCDNHTIENADENGVCKSCGYCTEKNSSSCPFYKKVSKDSNCSFCKNSVVKSGGSFTNSDGSGKIAFNDYARAYVNGITIGEKTPTLVALSSGGTQYGMGGKLYDTLFNADGSFKTTQIVFEIDLGIPNEEQRSSLIEGKNYVNAPDASKPCQILLRLGESRDYYSAFLYTTTSGKLSFTTSGGFVDLPRGTTATFKIVLDFSEAKPDDYADPFTVSVYDENGKFLATNTTTTALDIGKYSSFAQLRFNTDGSILVDNLKAYTYPNTISYQSKALVPENAPTRHTYGTDTKLPTPTRDGYIFDGWYLDEELTVATDVIPANLSAGAINVYAKWVSVYGDEQFDDTELDGNISTGGSSATFNIKDGKLYWTATGTYTTLKPTKNDIRDSESEVFSVILKLEKPADTNFFTLQLSMQEEILKFDADGNPVMNGDKQATENITSLLMRVNTSNKVIPGYSSPELMEITKEGATVVVTVDFAKELVYIYNGDGVLLHKAKLKLPAGTSATTGSEWRKKLRSGVNLRLDNTSVDGAAVIDGFTVVDGYYFD